MTFPLHTIDLSASIYRPAGGTFRLTPEGEMFRGQWSTNYRSAGPRSMFWGCELEMAVLFDDGSEDRRIRFEVEIARMQDGFIACRLFHPLRAYPRGMGAGIFMAGHTGGEYTIDGEYLIDGAYKITDGSTIAYVGTDAPRYANAIHLTGLVPSQKVFKAGDHFEVGGNLYMVSDDCLSDANGESTVPFLWKLWKPALAGDQVNLHKPTARFVLASKDTGSMRMSDVTGQASLQAIEIPYAD